MNEVDVAGFDELVEDCSCVSGRKKTHAADVLLCKVALLFEYSQNSCMVIAKASGLFNDVFSESYFHDFYQIRPVDLIDTFTDFFDESDTWISVERLDYFVHALVLFFHVDFVCFRGNGNLSHC